jgi:CYTH domain-containing protein
MTEVKRGENIGPRQEVERRFLVATMPVDYDKFPHKELKTGYLSIGDGIEDRIRQDGPVFERITKSGKGLKQIEAPSITPLTEDEFNELWQQIVVGKSETRYFIPVEGGIAELKTMHGRDEGKGEVEVEFESEETAKAFNPAVWFGKEITDDDTYTSKNLAPNGYPEEAALPL